MTERREPENLPEELGGMTQPNPAVSKDNTPASDHTPMRPAVSPPPPEPLESRATHGPYMRPTDTENTQERARPNIHSQNTMPAPPIQPQPAQRAHAAPSPVVGQNVPAVRYKRPRKARKSAKRGCAVGPSCLIGCFSVVGITLITVLFSGWLTYRSYTSNLNALLDDFDTRVEAQDFGTTFIYDRDGTELGKFAEQGRRERVPIEEIPDVVIYATIALEDDSFYENIGVDLPSMFRALRDNALQGQIVSGASTITQQLVRNILFDENRRNEQSVDRKIDEALLAITLTQRMSKDEILELYLNEINYGNGAYGIEAAAQVYFGKPATELNLNEASLLVGIPQAPFWLDPLSPDPSKRQAILDRQRLVLDLMVEEGYITEEQAEAAKQEPLVFAPNEVRFDNAPHFLFFSKDQTLSILSSQYEAIGYLPEDADLLAQQRFDSGLRVYTTLDLDMQRIAENSAQTNVANLRDRHDLTNASVVVMEPSTGRILAMVGSVDFNDPSIDGQVNVSLAQRQPGSTMKIFTYAAAIERGWLPSEIIWDTNVSIGIPGQPAYEPQNYDRRQHGPVHLRDALANSYNIPAVQTLRFVGVEYLLDMMQNRMGVESLNRGAENYGLSLTLGGGEVTLLELTTAYGVYANNGVYVAPQAITCIIDDDDDSIIYEYDGGCPEGVRTNTSIGVAPNRVAVMDPRVAYVMSDFLADNAARTPAMGANSPLNTGSLVTSVKTGTTNDFRDNWTVGYTNDIVVGVWSGNSDNRPMINISGLQGAAPIWRDTIQGIYNTFPLPAPQLVPPAGMYQSQICNARQLRDPAAGCPSLRQEWFFESQVLVGDGNGNLVPAPLPAADNQPSQFGPVLEEVQTGIIRTWVRPLTPDQVNFFVATNPGSSPQKYCMVPQEILSQIPDSQQLLFVDAPDDPGDARRAYEYALNPSINYAILPQFACTPETISGGLPTVSAGGGDWEVNGGDLARTAAIYCKGDGSIEIYEVVGGGGQLAFAVSSGDVAAVGFAPGENRLIREGGQTNVRLYRLGSGEFQVNAPANGDPNGYVYIWGGC